MRVGALPIVAGLVLGLASGVAAQEIRGALFEESGGFTRRPVAGAFTALLVEDGGQVDQTFSRTDGSFLLVAPAPGVYRVRVRRIGIEDWTSEPFEVSGEGARVSFSIPIRPVRLRDLRVAIPSQCLLDPDEDADVYVVWLEARKALETASWLDSQRQTFEFALRRYVRMQDPETLGNRGGESRTDTLPPPPFESLPAARLARVGYAEPRVDGIYFYAPDAARLSSDEFRRSHCFGLDYATRDGRELIGLEFEPRAEIRVPSIEGTMWIDAATYELRSVEYGYTNVALPQGADHRRVGGEVRFSRLPNGPFFVEDWWIRMPLRYGTEASQRRQREYGAQPPGVGWLAGYREEGGEVTDVFEAGRLVYSVGGAALEGVVFDSVRGVPLAGAIVSLESTLVDASTDDRGRFEIRGLPPGVYRATISHHILDALGQRIEAQVEVEASERSHIELGTSGLETTFAALCPAIGALENRGAIAGAVRDGASGAPLDGVPVTARWLEFVVRIEPGEEPTLDRSHREIHATTDGDGVFHLCGVPGGHQIEIDWGIDEERSEFVVQDRRILVLDFVTGEDS